MPTDPAGRRYRTCASNTELNSAGTPTSSGSPMCDTKQAATPAPLDELLRHALTNGCATVLDEADIANVVDAVLSVCRVHAHAEYDRGMESGDYFARQRIANRLGLGDIR